MRQQSCSRKPLSQPVRAASSPFRGAEGASRHINKNPRLGGSSDATTQPGKFYLWYRMRMELSRHSMDTPVSANTAIHIFA